MSGSLNIIILAMWLSIATTSKAQPHNVFVLDTSGEPVETDEEYFIKPAITDNGGRSTLINRNGSCPLYVGLENTDLPRGLSVKFTPFAVRHDDHDDDDDDHDDHDDDDDVRVNRDLKITFDASTSCIQSTEWSLGQNDTRSGRRLIITGRGDGRGTNYFRIVETKTVGIYNIRWCPTEACPTCRIICGTVGILRENGKILLALDGDALPVVFQKE